MTHVTRRLTAKNRDELRIRSVIEYGLPSPIACINVVDGGLQAYTQYNYSVTASNSVGSVTSDWTTATTLQASPEQLASPVCYTDQLDAIQLSWAPPALPNGLPSACLSPLYHSI